MYVPTYNMNPVPWTMSGFVSASGKSTRLWTTRAGMNAHSTPGQPATLTCTGEIKKN